MADRAGGNTASRRELTVLGSMVLAILSPVLLLGWPQGPAVPLNRREVVERPLRSSAADCPELKAPRVNRNAPGAGLTVALTFDDGPGPYTAQVLEVLRREKVPASFFLMGEQAAARPELVDELSAAGHLIGIHGWSLRAAPFHTPWEASTLDRQLSRAEDAIASRGTERLDCWFRPPNRAMDGVQPTARQRGLTVALWTVDSGDWGAQIGRSSAPRSLVDAIVRRATAAGDQQHPVVVLHDGGGYRGATVAALPRIIAFYRSHGYRFLRLDGQP